MTAGDKDFWFYYDANGTPYALFYNGAYYYYITNAQGDVMGITDRNGNVVVQYTYDAWGNVLSTTGTYASSLGQTNPIRYRGYVYDQETGLYYLQSRYYNPEVGRFINADNYPSTGQGLTGNNMFAYCGNNPVCRKDISGTNDEEIFGEDSNLFDNYSDLKGTGSGGSVSTTQPTQSGRSSSYNYNGSKTAEYVSKRGWTDSKIQEAMTNGQTGESINRANGNPCSVYSYSGSSNQYVVIDNITRGIVQVSNLHDPGWIPDKDIRWIQK